MRCWVCHDEYELDESGPAPVRIYDSGFNKEITNFKPVYKIYNKDDIKEKFRPINLCPKCIRMALLSVSMTTSVASVAGMDTWLRVDYDYYGEEDGE